MKRYEHSTRKVVSETSKRKQKLESLHDSIILLEGQTAAEMRKFSLNVKPMKELRRSIEEVLLLLLVLKRFTSFSAGAEYRARQDKL